ncbi:hypothetical protein Syun_014375 [Stephania yunnanensis]|uniref:Uncharacterized protein n=1 Tax=Stephania yunnanensis TaxID=152371 RepID=A0AAP0JLC3_9MAGN
MAETTQSDLLPREDDAGAAFVLASKGSSNRSFIHSFIHSLTSKLSLSVSNGENHTERFASTRRRRRRRVRVSIERNVVARRVSLNDGDRRADAIVAACEKEGRRHIRFRELAAAILGNRFALFFALYRLICSIVNCG